MDWKLFSQLMATFLVAGIGWWVAHTLTSKRDLANERRKLRITYLLEVYRKLETAANAANPKSKWDQVETSIADIQLLGSSRQAQLAREFAQAISDKSDANLNDLLFDLRQSLRAELQIETIPEKLVFLRFNRNA